MELWQLMSWVQSDHHVVNFLTWGFGICETAHRIWLKILSTALEKDLTMLNEHYHYLVSLTVFLFSFVSEFSHFSD